jgi:hypothetical protein
MWEGVGLYRRWGDQERVGLQLTKIPMLEGVVLHPNWGIKLFNCKSNVIKGTVDGGSQIGNQDLRLILLNRLTDFA